MKWGPWGGFGQKSELLMSFQKDHSAAVLRAVLLMVVEGAQGWKQGMKFKRCL